MEIIYLLENYDQIVFYRKYFMAKVLLSLFRARNFYYHANIYL